MNSRALEIWLDERWRDTLELILNRVDGKDEELTYPLNAVEKAVLPRKMGDYCQQQIR